MGVDVLQNHGFDWLVLVIAVIIVIVVVAFQIRSFKETRAKIRELASFFPNTSGLTIIKSSITKSILESKLELKEFITNPPARHTDEISAQIKDESDEDVDSEVETIEYTDVDLIKYPSACTDSFMEVLDETNAYLCKNIGTSAEFSILQDICERKIDVMESQIQSTLNVPLYLGLGGTFTGIIVGISGIVFNIDKLFTGAAGSSDPLRNLLVGVVVAMLASLLGLGLMTWNSSIEYKRALKLCDRDKNSYFDFIRRELMPSLSNSMAASLNSLKGVLGEFIGKFGRNLSDYSNSAGLLNDNIEKQHLLLVEINKMNQTQMATTIAKTFKDISDASEAFNTFKSYQDNLNNTVKNVDAAVSRIEDVADSFDDFAKALNVVVENQGAATELQAQFRAAIEQHFPIGSEAREMWRKEFDLLSSDATTVSNELNDQLRAATQYIRTFSENNQEIFSSMSKFKDVLDSLVKYSEVQASCYKDLKDEIKELKQVQIKNQADSAKLNADLLTAVREMIGAVKTLKD